MMVMQETRILVAYLFYKKSIIYAKSKDKNYLRIFYYDIYSSDFSGKNVKLIKRNVKSHMVIDD